MEELQRESSVKQIPFPQQTVYNKLSDLNNFTSALEHLNNPAARAKMQERGATEKDINQLSEQLKSITYDRDSVSCNVSPFGTLSLRIIERDEPKCIKFESVNSPVPANLWIQILPVTETKCKMRLTLRARLNAFMKGMIEPHLSEGIEKLADVLSSLPYETNNPDNV